MCLNGDAGIYGSGELYWYGSEASKERFWCPCGEKITSCQFWTQVDETWKGVIGPAAASSHWGLKQRYEGPRFQGLGRTVFQRVWRSAAFEEYCRQNYWLLYAIAKTSGKSVIVDSSALPTRGLAYYKNPYVRLRSVHLVRDPRGVVRSMQKALSTSQGVRGVGCNQSPRTGLRTAATWIGYNSLAEWTLCSLYKKPCITIRYEDLVRQPGESLRAIGKRFGIELNDVAAKTEDCRAVYASCCFGGNRARMNGSLHLSLDEAWREELTAITKAATAVLTLPLLLRYGYSPFGGRR